VFFAHRRRARFRPHGFQFASDHLGQSEIKNLGMATVSDEDVCRLDVPMDDALGVRRIESVGDIDADLQYSLQLQRATGDQVLQCSAIQKLHDDEGLAFVLPDLVDCAYIGMVQRRSSASFAAESFKSLLVLGYIFR